MDRSLQELVDKLNRIRDISPDIRNRFMQAVTISGQDPEMSLTRGRTILESIVHDIHRRKINEPGTQPLERLIQNIVKDGAFPRRLAAYAQTVKDLGNIGAHGVAEKIGLNDVTQSLSSLLPILEWYVDQERPGSAEQPQFVSNVAADTAPTSTVVAPPTASGQASSQQPTMSGPRRRVVRPPMSGLSGPHAAARPPGSSSSSASGIHAVVTPAQGPPPRPTGYVENVASWILGAIGGATLGGNVGGICGALMYAMGVRMWEGKSEVISSPLLLLSLIGAPAGTLVVVLSERRWPQWGRQARGIVAAATVGSLMLLVLGRLEQIAVGRTISVSGPMLAISGGMVGVLGGVGCILGWQWRLRLVLGAAIGSVALLMDTLLLAQHFHLGACVIFGGLVGLGGAFAAMVVMQARHQWGVWLLGATVAWAAIEAVAFESFALFAVALLAGLGCAVGAISQSVFERPLAANRQ